MQEKKIGKLKRELKFLERDVQRVKTKLQKLQDPTLTPSTSPVYIQLKQLINQHDYHTMTQGKVHDTHDHDTYTNLYSAIEQQVRIDAMLLRQIQAEEQKCFEEYIKQLENKRSH